MKLFSLNSTNEYTGEKNNYCYRAFWNSVVDRRNLSVCMDSKLIRSNTQRFICLDNAFKSVDAFIIPSANPEILEKYEDVKKYLIDMYGEDVPDGEIENYKFRNEL